MARTSIFMQPIRLPLTADTLTADDVRPIADLAAARRALDTLFPALDWLSEQEGRGDDAGRWLEFGLSAETGISLRCSLRAEHYDVVQRICDGAGWVAFDETARCYQPGHPPFQA